MSLPVQSVTFCPQVFTQRDNIDVSLLQTTGATDWEFFSVDDDFFLVVANAFNFGPHADEKTERYR